MDIEIAGHSGCNIEVKKDGGRLFVRKSTGQSDYAVRLQRQAMKQRAYGQRNSKYFRVPQVYDVSLNEKGCSVDMEFVYSQHFVEFFENSGFENLTSFIDLLLSFLEEEIDASPLADISGSLLSQKFVEVRKAVAENDLVGRDAVFSRMLEQLEGVFRNIGKLRLPMGVCHGDLTLSNILFNGRNYYLIDLLDSFIETPLMDIVKLRQDTRYGWSFMMYQGEYDRTRNAIIVDYIDKKIVERFGTTDFYEDYYGLFQIMNFLRILQYVRRTDVAAFVKNVLGGLIAEYVN